MLLALWPFQAAALDPTEKPGDYILTRWDAEDGLPHNSVKQIFQTRDGYLWIGTSQGLARFDGLTFTIFSHPATPGMPANQITSLAETRDGSLWIATVNGLARYHDGRFTAYGRAHGLKSEIINGLCVAADGSLWIGGREGVTRWVDGKFVNDIDTSSYDTLAMRHIALDRQNALWLSIGAEAFRYAGGKFTRFGRAEGLPAQPLQMIGEDGGGQLLAVTQNGLFRLEGERFVPFELNVALSSPRLTTAFVDRGGNLWLGSVGGLDRYSGGQVVPYVNAQGQRLTGVDALFEDREGCLWVGGPAGLARLTDRRGHMLGKEQGVLGSLGMAVRQSRDGSVWVSSWAGGVARFKNGEVRQYAAGAPLSHESVTAIYEAPDGTMWFGNRGSSLDRLEGDKVTTFVYQPGVATSRPVSAIHIEPEGEFLVGIVQRGLLQLREGQLSPVPEAEELAAESVRAIHRTRDGRLLIGTSRGIFQREPSRAWRPVTPPGLTQSPEVRAFLEEPDGVIWLATAGSGLVRWAPGQARAYGTREGMVDNTLFSVVDDGAGSLWVSSSRGMARVRKTELADLDRGAIAHLNGLTLGRVDGLSSGATPGSGVPAAVLLTDGRLMTATDKGIAVVDPRTLQMNSQPPTVIVESVVADDRPLALAPGRMIAVPSGTNRLEFRYTALSLIAPQRLRFRYWLEGSDPDWIEAGRERSARYTHLRPGTYTFHVLACNNDGVWTKTDASLAVTLQPLLYQTLGFRLGVVALLVGLLAAAIGLRLRQLKQREHELARINSELDQRVRERTAKLAETSGLLEAMLENSPDLIYFKDRDSRFVRFSKSCLPHLGFAAPEMLQGKTAADLYGADAAQATFADEQAIMRRGEPLVDKLESHAYPDGRRGWTLTTKMPWRDGTGAVVGTFGISKDVTALKETEAKLAHERDQLRALLDSSPDAIYFKDLESRFVLASRSKVEKAIAEVPDLRARRAAIGRPTDVPELELLNGLTDFDTYQNDDARKAFEAEQEIVRTGEAQIGSLEKHVFHSGTVTWQLASKMPWRDPAGKIVGTFGISKDITALKEAEAKLEETHRQLMDLSRQAGMAEVASGVLHNVGNVLNSVNVSATLVEDGVRRSKATNIGKLAALLEERKADLAHFITVDPRGRTIPVYLATLAESLAAERAGMLGEIGQLRKNIEHIKDIVAMQQSFARTSGVTETISVPDLIEDALRMNAASLTRHAVEMVRDYRARPVVSVDKHKVMQILVNLIANAKHACDDSGRLDKRIVIRVTEDARSIAIAVTDNGVGIPAENLTRIFNHGFTTRKNGHGFGLHSGALAAKEIGGSLNVHSDGRGCGATFVLELPVTRDAPDEGKSASPAQPALAAALA